MPYGNLVHIYDADDWITRQTAVIYNFRESDVKPVGVRGGIQGLLRELDTLLKQKWVFTRVVFSTHGNAGHIHFKGEPIGVHTLTKEFAHRGYERLFPVVQTRMYFNGCNVADGDKGWNFLEKAAYIFLKTMGGVAFGDTSKGFAMHPIIMPFMPPWLYPMVAGKVIHPWGDTRYVFVGPGGNFVKREEN